MRPEVMAGQWPATGAAVKPGIVRLKDVQAMALP
jgi:hypothetical protein